MEVDLRSEGPGHLEALEETVMSVCHEEVRRANAGSGRDQELTLHIHQLGRRPAGATDPSHALVQAAVNATRNLGVEPTLTASSTDANLPMSLGVPSVTLGAGGRGGKVHTLDEWFENEDGPM